MSLNGTGNGEKGAQHKVHRGHRECEVTDVIFATTGNRACLGMCDGFAGDLHDSQITSHLRTARPPWDLRFSQLWRRGERDFSGYSEEQGLLGPLSRSS